MLAFRWKRFCGSNEPSGRQPLELPRSVRLPEPICVVGAHVAHAYGGARERREKPCAGCPSVGATLAFFLAVFACSSKRLRITSCLDRSISTIGLALCSAWRFLMGWRDRSMRKGPRRIRVLPPPETHPDQARLLWLSPARTAPTVVVAPSARTAASRVRDRGSTRGDRPRDGHPRSPRPRSPGDRARPAAETSRGRDGHRDRRGLASARRASR
jgi:hypothetical protein